MTVQRFDIQGNSVFGTDDLQRQIAAYVGQSLTLAELYKVADELTRYYQSHGYGLARVAIPEQKFEGGTVTLLVMEGRIGERSVQGNTRTRTGVLLTQSSNLGSGDVYTDAAMDRSVLLLNDLPGVQAQAVLQPGASFGTADVVYNVQESPYDGHLSMDNYGQVTVGQIRFNADMDINSVSGRGDRLSANYTHSAGDLLNFGGLTYSLPAGAPGGRLTAAYNRSTYEVSGPRFQKLVITGASENGTFSYLYPEIRGRSENLYLGLGMQHSAGNTDSRGQFVSGTNLNALQLIFYYNRIRDTGGYWTLNGSFATNGKLNDGTRNNAEQARAELDASWVQPFAGKWSFVGRGGGVWSADPLIDTEKFSLGGPDSVRGYLSGEARGDSGLYASAEVQYSLAPAWPFNVGGFVDGGKVWNQASVAGPGDSQALGSGGLELVFASPGGRWDARVQWAHAFGGTKPSDGSNGGRFWASLGMSF